MSAIFGANPADPLAGASFLPSSMRIMIIGASNNRAKFGNKAVRAYLRRGHTVLPVNPNEVEVERLAAYPNIASVPGPIDRALFYVPPEVGIDLLDDIADRGDIDELWLNPGAESPALLAKARVLGLSPVQACAIVDIGENPH